MESLPLMKLPDFNARISKGEQLVILYKYVIDISKFKNEHPGGADVFKGYIGKDVSQLFKSHNHPDTALKYLTKISIAKYEPKAIVNSNSNQEILNEIVQSFIIILIITIFYLIFLH